MIQVKFADDFVYNEGGICRPVPTLLTIVYLNEPPNPDDIWENIKRLITEIFLQNVYPNLMNISIYVKENGIATLHYQTPARTLQPDSMNPVLEPVSYYGTIRLSQIPGSISDLSTGTV